MSVGLKYIVYFRFRNHIIRTCVKVDKHFEINNILYAQRLYAEHSNDIPDIARHFYSNYSFNICTLGMPLLT